MKSFLIAFIVFLIWAFFGLWLYSWLNTDNEPTASLTEKTINNDTLSQNNIVVDSSLLQTEKVSKNDSIFETENEEKAMTVKDSDGTILFLFDNGITSKKNSEAVTIPSASIDFKYKINTYLIEHPNKEVHINSLYSAEENIQTPNLGIKRGKKIKEQLIKTGVPSEKIVIKPIIKDVTFSESDTLNNAISFSFATWDQNREIEQEEINLPESIYVYPKFSDTGIIVNNNLRNLLKEVKLAFEETPNLTIEIIGHTDNVGNASDNYRMGLQYAREVRWYLISKGNFKSSAIKASSKGELDPIDTNNSKRGRQANRRIEVVYNYNE